MAAGVSTRRHAQLARALIAACGGLEEAAAACRVGKSTLGRAQDPTLPDCLAVDVVAALETYCGCPLYSTALVEAVRAGAGAPASLLADVCDVTEAASGLQQQVRQALADGAVSPRERDRLIAAAHDTQRELADVIAGLEGNAHG